MSARKVLRSSPWARHFFNHLRASREQLLGHCGENCSERLLAQAGRQVGYGAKKPRALHFFDYSENILRHP